MNSLSNTHANKGVVRTESKREIVSNRFKKEINNFNLQKINDANDDENIISYLSDNTYYDTNNKIYSYFRKLAVEYGRSSNVKIIIITASFVSCVMYVINSYDQGKPSKLSFGVDSVLTILFGVDYFFNILNAPFLLKYLLGDGLMDLASCLSILNNILGTVTVFSFLPLLRLLRVLKLVRMHQSNSVFNVHEKPKDPSTGDVILFELMSLAFNISLGLYLSASILFMLISYYPDTFVHVVLDTEADVTWFDCLYIDIVILGTLGFGDYVPGNNIGKIYVILLLAYGLSLIPFSIGKIMDTFSKRPHYMSEVGTIHRLLYLHVYSI